METLYINKSGEASLDLIKVLEACQFRSHCGEFNLEDKKVCEGKEEDYTNCDVWLYYMEQDAQRERIRRGDF